MIAAKPSTASKVWKNNPEEKPSAATNPANAAAAMRRACPLGSRPTPSAIANPQAPTATIEVKETNIAAPAQNPPAAASKIACHPSRRSDAMISAAKHRLSKRIR